MKKLIFLALATLIGLLSVSSCSNEFEQKGIGDYMVYRTYQSSFHEDTKTSLEDSTVNWSKGDIIKYYSSDGGNIGTFSIEEDVHNAAIRVKMSQSDDYLVAVYGGETITNHTKGGFTLAGVAEAVQNGSFGKAHVSVAYTSDVTSKNLLFYTITGMVQFTISQPGVKYVMFTSGDGTQIAGDGSVDVEFTELGINSDFSSNGGGDCIRVDVDGTGTFYLSTLPCSIGGFRIEMYGADNNKISEVSSGNTLSLMAGSVINLGAIDNRDEINQSFVPIDWTDVELTGYSDDSDTFTMTFSGQVPDIKVGSILSVDADTTGSIRIVKDVNVSGRSVSVTTVEGDLCDIFANTTLVLSTESEPSSAPTKGIDGGNVIYARPVACIYEKNGRLYRQPIDLPTKGSTTLSGELLTWDPDLSGSVLWKNGGCKLSIEEASFHIDVDLRLSMNFGSRNPITAVAEAVSLYRSKALSISSYLNGDFNTTQILRFDAGGSTDYDKSSLLKKNFFPPKMLVFFAGNVPIYVKVSGDLYLDTHVDAKGEMYYRMGFTDNANAKIGFNWTQSGGITPITSFSNQLKLVPPTLDGSGFINGKFWLYPKFNLLVYSFLGPTFTIKPYLSATLAGGIHATAYGASEDYAAWSVKANTGVDATAGLRMDFIGKSYEYDTPNLNLGDKLLFSSPAEIVFNGESDFKAKVGKSNELTFTVMDYNGLIGKNVVTNLSQIVRFTGDGDISGEYGICKDGKVTVDWTPEAEEDVFKATLYAFDGSVIDECEVSAGPDELCPDDSHVHAIDLGLSVKWACCNVGASSPEEYGGYYAWGETSTKSVYNEVTYSYAHGVDTDGNGSYDDDGYYDNIGSDISGTQYDVAHVKWGGKWRMPTYAEFNELDNNCDSEWTTLNGVKGRKFTSRKNGNSIFLPAAGYRYGSDLGNVGSYGTYWSSSLGGGGSYRAWGLYFISDSVGRHYGSRCGGRTVRPVSE